MAASKQHHRGWDSGHIMNLPDKGTLIYPCWDCGLHASSCFAHAPNCLEKLRPQTALTNRLLANCLEKLRPQTALTNRLLANCPAGPNPAQRAVPGTRHIFRSPLCDDGHTTKVGQWRALTLPGPSQLCLRGFGLSPLHPPCTQSTLMTCRL